METDRHILLVKFLYLFTYGLFNDAVTRSYCISLDDRMDNELERVWKEAVLA